MSIFLLFLAGAVWQDIRTREVKKSFLIGFGILGVAYCFIQGREWPEILISSSAGILILILGRLSGGGIGEGDGWFFLVAGFFLKPLENFLILLLGIFFSGIFGLVLSAIFFSKGGQIKKLRMPFLPFLVPACLWLLIL